MNKNRKKLALTLALAVLIAFCLVPSVCYASYPTDEILDYTITADVNDDGTVKMLYHIDWKVLDSDELGPLSWVQIGLPNPGTMDIYADSDNIDDIYFEDSYAFVYFDRDYYEDEIVSFDFTVTQDYMYQMNLFQEGMTSYGFTPGWFDEIAIDHLAIYWNSDKAVNWSPDCLVKDGYNVWETSLAPGKTFTIRVNYNNDAFGFDETKMLNSPDSGYDDWDDDWDDDWNGGYNDSSSGVSDFFAGLIGFFMLFGIPFLIIRKIVKGLFNAGRGLNGGEEKTKTKVTRTKVTYYPVCQGCGAPRGEGETVCSHCGRSYVKSEEILKEEELKGEDKQAMKYTTNGEYAYDSSPNTFVRVNVVHIPVPRSSGSSRSSGHPRSSSGRSHSSSGSSRSSSGRSHSSCVHSSCACACVSCACACACACAGGGRAGCTEKDFYKTDLKLKQLELKKKIRNKKQ